MPNYVPGDTPTVPGHEAVVRIVKVGPGVDRYKIGERFIVETDYRWLPTDKSNAAFGYNFEGGLQEYVLLDERVITSPEGESMLIPAPEDLSASALALVEPWACVENAYTEVQRRTLKPGGRLLVVGRRRRSTAPSVDKMSGATRLDRLRRPAPPSATSRTGPTTTSSISAPTPATAEKLFAKLAAARPADDRPGRPQVRPSGRTRRSAASITAASASSEPPAPIRRRLSPRFRRAPRSARATRSTSSARRGRWERCT